MIDLDHAAFGTKIKNRTLPGQQARSPAKPLLRPAGKCSPAWRIELPGRLRQRKKRVEWGVLKFPLLAACGALALGAFAGCASPGLPPLRTVGHVDMDRYLGRWYVIANIPYFLENGKVASYDTYARRPDGKLDNLFTFRRGGLDAPEQSWHGTAWVTNTATNAEWKVRFIWPFSSTYLVLELDPDYRWAVVGTPGRGLLWILARERQMSAADYEHVLTLTERQGYDRTKIIRVPQPGP